MVGAGGDVDAGPVAAGGPVGDPLADVGATDEGILVLGVLPVARDAAARVGGVASRDHRGGRRVAVRAGPRWGSTIGVRNLANVTG